MTPLPKPSLELATHEIESPPLKLPRTARHNHLVLAHDGISCCGCATMEHSHCHIVPAEGRQGAFDSTNADFPFAVA